MNSSVSLGPIGQIAMTVEDLPSATAFYRDSLGLPFLFEVPGMAFFNCGGTRLMIGLPQGIEAKGNSILYFRVEDISAAHQALQERGVPFIRPPEQVADLGTHLLWLAFMQDPEENLLALMSEVPKQ